MPKEAKGQEGHRARRNKPHTVWGSVQVVLAPETTHPREPSHYRPVVLTAHLMKATEKTVLCYLRTQVDSTLDPLQFAYRPRIAVDDVVIYLFHRALCRLGSHVLCLRQRLSKFWCGQLTSSPTDPQHVRLQDCASEVHLGVHLNKKLGWSCNTDALYKKGQWLQRLRSFRVSRALLRTFCDTVLPQQGYPVLGVSSTDRHRKRLNKQGGSVLGCILDSTEEEAADRNIYQEHLLPPSAPH